MLNLVNHEADIGKIYLYAKDPYKAKYEFLFMKRESTCLKYLNDSKVFIEYSNDMDDICRNIEKYNPNKIQKILIAFDMIGHMLSNKKLNPIATELFFKGTKRNISLAFITQSYFSVLKNINLNLAHYFVMKIPNKREIHEILNFRTL